MPGHTGTQRGSGFPVFFIFIQPFSHDTRTKHTGGSRHRPQGGRTFFSGLSEDNLHRGFFLVFVFNKGKVALQSPKAWHDGDRSSGKVVSTSILQSWGPRKSIPGSQRLWGSGGKPPEGLISRYSPAVQATPSGRPFPPSPTGP